VQHQPFRQMPGQPATVVRGEETGAVAGHLTENRQVARDNGEIMPRRLDQRQTEAWTCPEKVESDLQFKPPA
jgi:hypothetical protein